MASRGEGLPLQIVLQASVAAVLVGFLLGLAVDIAAQDPAIFGAPMSTWAQVPLMLIVVATVVALFTLYRRAQKEDQESFRAALREVTESHDKVTERLGGTVDRNSRVTQEMLTVVRAVLVRLAEGRELTSDEVERITHQVRLSLERG